MVRSDFCCPVLSPYLLKFSFNLKTFEAALLADNSLYQNQSDNSFSFASSVSVEYEFFYDININISKFAFLEL